MFEMTVTGAFESRYGNVFVQHFEARHKLGSDRRATETMHAMLAVTIKRVLTTDRKLSSYSMTTEGSKPMTLSKVLDIGHCGPSIVDIRLSRGR
jgi:hypothetical protein